MTIYTVCGTCPEHRVHNELAVADVTLHISGTNHPDDTYVSFPCCMGHTARKFISADTCRLLVEAGVKLLVSCRNGAITEDEIGEFVADLDLTDYLVSLMASLPEDGR